MTNAKHMPYELRLEKFQGPLDKLLELIEERKFDVSELSLAQVTDDFLRYLRSLTNSEGLLRESALSERESASRLRLVADFIVVASRLILIKSKHILPDLILTGEEEIEIKDLERRLKLYAELKPMMKNIARLWSGKKASFGRPYFLEIGSSSGVFYPGENLELRAIVAELAKLFESIKRLELETETIKEKIITIEEKIKEIMERLRAEKETKFSHLAGAKTKQEILAIFLAILHLAREQLIFLEQAERFSDILIKRNTNLQIRANDTNNTN